MIRRRHIVAALAGALVLHAADAAGEPVGPDNPPLHLTTPSHVITQGGSELDLPPGYFLDDEQWSALDTELRRLQDEETRLGAENQSLRASAHSGAPWWAIGAAVVVGAVAGAYAWERWGP